MQALIKAVRADFPQFNFERGDVLRWSARIQTIFYTADSSSSGILHELGHALLGHATYQKDFELLQMELAAWHKAQELSSRYQVAFDKPYIQHCLDSYRDWLDRRSTCPTCKSHGVQATQRRYTCPNCTNSWQVSASVLCRPYRRTQSAAKQKSPAL